MLKKSDYKVNIPVLSPLSEEYSDLWEREYNRIIEGYWVGNVYMTGPMYFYTNHWHIELTNEATKTRIIGSPDLRDIEFKKFYTYLIAKGFSGFEEDDDFHCNYALRDIDKRVFLEPIQYLYKKHKRALGRPLYKNPLKNILEIGCRGYGKTFGTSGIVYHNYITDGINNIDEALDIVESTGNPFANKSISVFGAIDTKYSNKIVNALNIGMKYLKGGYKLDDMYYPPPLSRRNRGTLKAGGDGLFNEWKEKEGNNDIVKGTGSSIHHVTFYQNPHAANGFRNSICVLDEIGFFDNLLDTWGQLKECTSTDDLKIGVIWALGTGGDMKGGSTEAAKEVFYHPEDYDCIVFKDEWENKGNCGLFIPRTMVMGTEFKDELGNTLFDKALDAWQDNFDKKKKAADKSVVDMFLQNNPIKPSHAFLSSEGSLYPIAQISEHLAELQTLREKKELLGTIGRLEFKNDDSLNFIPDDSLKPIDYPIKNNKKGGIIIYEHPTEDKPKGKYIAGLDPTGAEGAVEDIQSDSVLSIYIYKRCTEGDLDGDKLVAEYTGREDTFNDTFEHARKLLMYYNAFCLYENNFSNFKSYIENKKQLYLLCKTPASLTNIAIGKEKNTYGIRMTKQIAEISAGYLRDWLLEKAPNGKLNLQNIYSIGLLKELLAAGEKINTDREVALKLIMILRQQLERVKVQETKQKAYDTFLFESNGIRRRFFVN